MKWPTLALTALLVASLGGCGSGDSGEAEPGEPPETAPAEAPPPATAPPVAAPEARPAPSAPIVRTAPTEEPWSPTDTGTVDPGMSRDAVVSAWGTPVTERAANGRSYLYYRNGCEVSCGTFDVVFLEDNQVVDAIVRWRGHRYSGTSSSPPGSEGAPTLPGRAGG